MNKLLFLLVMVSTTDSAYTQLLEKTNVSYALHTDTAQTTVDFQKKYQIGDFALGGIVFWVNEKGDHGLVCAKSDQSKKKVSWRTRYIYQDGSHLEEANIIRLCNELKITEGGKMYDDWYLPSKEELNLMYLNSASIDATAKANGGLHFRKDLYWAFIAPGEYFQWVVEFGDDLQQGHGWPNRHTPAYIRVIRSF